MARPAGAWRRFFAALVALVVVLVGIPLLLVLFSRLGLEAAHPFPGIGSAEEIKQYFERDLTPTEIAPIALRSLLLVGWALWLAMALSVVSSIFEARGSGARSWLPQFAMFAGLSRWIAAGLTAVSSLAPNFVSAASLASPRPFTISSITPESTTIDEAPPAPGFARVQRGESIETFAQRTLGDADRWPELWELNQQQPVGPSGEVWTVAWKLGAGWDLRLPADATPAVDTMTGGGSGGGARPAALMAPVVIDPAAPVTEPADQDTPPPDQDGAPAAPGEVTVIDGYEVVDGDSFWSIAERFLPDGAPDRDVWTYTQALMAHNAPRLGYDHPAMIHPGDHIDVVAPPSAAPGSTQAASGATTAPSHTVEAGDSYWAIAEETLGPDATPAEVLDRTHDLIDLNAPLLGYDDRRMIQPGDTVHLADPATVVDETPAPPTTTPATQPVVDPNIDAIAVDDLPAPPPDAVPAPQPPPPPAEPEAPAIEEAHDDSSPIGIGQAALIATGIVALLVARRRAKLRAAEPPARIPLPSPAMAATERMLRKLDSAERLLRVDIAVRAAAAVLAAGDHRITAVRCAPDGAVELHLTGPVTLDPPWVGDARCWTLPSRVQVDELAGDARSVGSPCVALTQIGVDADGWDVLVDLEAAGLLAIEADAESADAVVRAVAVGLASSEFAEIAHLVGVGVDDDAFLGHRHAQVVTSVDEAVELAATLIGTTATTKRTTFSLRAHHTGGEVWEPAVVLIASTHATDVTPDVATSIASRQGVAIVVAAPVPGAPWTLRAAGATWILDPLGLALRPVGIETDELADLVDTLDGDVVEAVVTEVPAAAPAFDAATFRPVADVAGDPAAEGHVLVMDVDSDDQGLDLPTIVVPADTTSRSQFEAPPWPAPNGNGNGHEVNGHGDHTVSPFVPSEPTAATETCGDAVVADEFVDPEWSLMVRLLGNVDVVDRDGAAARFERSKTLELVAWLVTHRERANRTAARTALWDLDVRDATFANVVSEARRAMARHVAPPEGDEWLRRTMTEELWLHDAVIADADIVRSRFEAASGRPPAAAMAILRPAVELVRELPFSGTSYLWPDAEGTTSNLVLLATNVTAEYATLALASGDVDGVFWATGRGLNVLAGQEALIALRMRAHAANGDLSGVRVEWESYERVINADPWCDGEPAPKLVALRKELLSK